LLDVYEVYHRLILEVKKYITLKTLHDASEKLGIYYAKHYDIQNKTEQAALYDFVIYEEIDNDNTIIESFKIKYNPKSELEENLIKGMLESYTSLFIVKGISYDKNEIMLQDIVSNRIIPLINNPEKFNVDDKTLHFLRIIKVGNIYISSDFQLLFPRKSEKTLRKLFNKSSLLERETTHRFINLFHYHRKVGSNR